jgi:hypothetical protein
MSTIKVLVSGDPQGKLGALFKRVAAVNKSNGPFDFLFCVGSFFPPSGAALLSSKRVHATRVHHRIALSASLSIDCRNGTAMLPSAQLSDELTAPDY